MKDSNYVYSMDTPLIIVLVVVLFGIFGVLNNFISALWSEMSASLDKGHNMIWLSGSIFIGLLILQIKKFYDFYEAFQNWRYSRVKWLVGFVIGNIVLFVLAYIVLNIAAQMDNPDIKAWAYETSKFFLKDNSNPEAVSPLLIGDQNLFFFIFMFFLQGLFLLGTITAGVFTFVMMGPITLGSSLAIALNNYFNGGGFDLSVFIDAFLEFSLPDFLALILPIVSTFMAFFFSKEPVSIGRVGDA